MRRLGFIGAGMAVSSLGILAVLPSLSGLVTLLVGVGLMLSDERVIFGNDR